ncbi:hypothetical protein Clacol_005993 [Clathrus columnatus]|uniref:Uncharacterized protein n=1 Tax=Clathrus columnatus TaxID=1419009 RepID=A0AAV5AII6_9AGAM|nr:hypothetical protein Clacol_005993 [Clathrus columnatus]
MSNQDPTTNSSAIPPIPPLSRRVITGVDNQSQKSKIIIDDRGGGHIESFPDDIYRFQTIWYTPSLPVDCSDTSDLDPMVKIKKLDDIPDAGVVQYNLAFVGNFVWTKPLASVPLHKTPSLDFGILLEGTMELLMEDGDVRVLNIG